MPSEDAKEGDSRAAGKWESRKKEKERDARGAGMIADKD